MLLEDERSSLGSVDRMAGVMSRGGSGSRTCGSGTSRSFAPPFCSTCSDGGSRVGDSAKERQNRSDRCCADHLPECPRCHDLLDDGAVICPACHVVVKLPDEFLKPGGYALRMTERPRGAAPSAIQFEGAEERPL